MRPEMPKFPTDWYAHCPKVLEAKDWYNRLVPNQEFDPADHAECAFHNAGNGMECENCNRFLTRPFLNHEIDKEFLPKIEQFYRDLESYELEVSEQNQSKIFVLDLDQEELEGLSVSLLWFRNEPKIHEQVNEQIRKKLFKLCDKVQELLSEDV